MAAVRQPGPRVTTAQGMRDLQDGAASLKHGARRSSGAGALRRSIDGRVSRRDLQSRITALRKHHNAQYRRGLKHLSWRGSDVVWAMDETEICKPGKARTWILNIRDLGSQYVMEPRVSDRMAKGSDVAAWLERLFRQHGAPLFLKRDNGSNLCSHEVDDVLARWMVLPLNSPPHYPRYNGAVEWSQGQLKDEIERISQECGDDRSTISLKVRLATHTINHRNSPVLGGRCPCHARNTGGTHFHRNERRVIMDWIVRETEIILCVDPESDRPAAWRKAVTRWLTGNGLLIIREPQRVSTDFPAEVRS